MPRIVDIQPGGEKYLALALSKLRQLKAWMKPAGLRVISKHFWVNSTDKIWIKALDLGNDLWWDWIRIEAGGPTFGFARFSLTAPSRTRIGMFERLGVVSTAPLPIHPHTPTYAPPFADLSPFLRYYFSQDGQSWLGQDVLNSNAPDEGGPYAYVRNGVLLATKVIANAVTRNGLRTGMAPDGAAWWVLYAGVSGGNTFIDQLFDDAALEIMRSNPAPTGPGDEVLTTKFDWQTYIEPLIQSIGLSTWSVSPDYRTNSYTPIDTGVPTIIIRAGASVLAPNVASLTYGWVESEFTGDVGSGPETLFTLKSRQLTVAVNSKHITRQGSGPTPGEFTIIYDETKTATSRGGFDAIAVENDESFFDSVNPFQIEQHHMTARGNTVVAVSNSKQVTGAGNNTHDRRRLFVNGAEVDATTYADGSSMTVGYVVDTAGAGLRFLYTKLPPSPGHQFLYDTGTITDLGVVGTDVFRLTEDGQYVIQFAASPTRVDILTKVLGTWMVVASRAGVTRATLIRGVGEYTTPTFFYGREVNTDTGVNEIRRYGITITEGVYSVLPEGAALLVPATLVVPVIPPTDPLSSDTFNRVVGGPNFQLTPFAMILGFE